MKGFLNRRQIPKELQIRLEDGDPEDGHYIAQNLQGALPAIALTGHPALSSAIANDVAADLVFTQQLYGYGHAGDTLLTLSTSGRSKNVIYAIKLARALKIHTVCMTGSEPVEIHELCDVSILAPETSTPRVQELHIAIYHWMCEALEKTFFGEQSST